MPFIYNDDGSTTLTVYYRKPGAKGGTAKRKTVKTQDDREIARAWAMLLDSVSESSSLTARFSECVELAVKFNRGAGMLSVYEILKDRLGQYRADKTFPRHFNAFIAELRSKGYAHNTVANYQSATRRALKVAWEQNLIAEIPIRKFEITRKFRNRIWTDEERLRFFNSFEDQDDDLYWKVYFAEKNPVRKMDVSGLKRENLVLFGEHAPYILHYPRKTEVSDPRPCILPEIDDALLSRFQDIQRRFPDCPYLFPRIIKNEALGTERWEYAGNYHKAFSERVERCKIENFHFHDLKHVAISAMLKGKYTREILKKLGIQMSDDSIDVYDQTNGLDALSMIRKNGNPEMLKKVI